MRIKPLTFKSSKILYNAYILSNFNYCPLVWNLSKGNMADINRAHLKALGVVYQNPKRNL